MQEQSIFVEALDKEEPAERAAFLNQVCAGDPALRQRIERLLHQHQEADSFLKSPAAALVGTIDEPLAEQPGAVIGPYKLLQQIGEGGMGVVYMAEQQEPVRRKVALKIIKPGLDSRQVIARFEAERQALAMMDHQNIAKVLDAGAVGPVCRTGPEVVPADGEVGPARQAGPTGRPYFVMELVHGIPITKYCDDHQLTPRQRLDLFIPVCHAVQHAHQKGIIHRDLKPSNILVTMHDDKPVPKVIDFGVAKAVEQRLTEKTLFTQFGTLVGTFEYMSPEQAEMNAFGVDTRSDIYSLGVLLYELLTGSTPLERQRLREAAYGDIVRLIKEEEPPRPSTRLSSSGAALAGISQQRGSEPEKLANLVRGELDWIVMRCLEKDRTRRYETANNLARDVERYLHDEPVEACPPTAGYKLRKFARKNRRLLATAAAFAGLLLLSVAASSWQAMRATQAEGVAVLNEGQAKAAAEHAQKKEQEATEQRDEVRKLNEQLRSTLYTGHMNLAQHAWEAGSVARVRELVERHRPKPGESDLRHFEWHYLHRLSHAELFTLQGHKETVHCVAFSPDGKRLASASYGDLNDSNVPGFAPGQVKVWDAQTGQEIFTLKDSALFASVVFSPDGKRLATGSRWRGSPFKPGEAVPGQVKLWDAQTGKELLALKDSNGFAKLAFSPDGKRLASGVALGLNLWDTQTGQVVLKCRAPEGFDVCSVAFSPDGKLLATAGDAGDANFKKEVKLWDAQTGQVVKTFKLQTDEMAGSVAFSPDGKRLACEEKVWDVQTGQEVQTRKEEITVYGLSLAFSPNGQHLVSGGSDDGTLKLWDSKTGLELFTFKGHTARITSVVFSADGQRLATASEDRTVKVWDAQINQQPLVLKGVGEINVASLAFIPDGKRLATGLTAFWRNNDVKLWDAQTGQELMTFKGHPRFVYSLAISPDGKLLAAGCGGAKGQPGEVKVWDAKTGQELLSLKGHIPEAYRVAFSPDSKRLASAGFDGIIKVWDPRSGQELHTLKDNGKVYGLAFSPDGKRLISVAQDGPVKVWDAQTGQELSTLKGLGAVYCAAISPDGTRLVSAYLARESRGQVKVWDAQTGKELFTIKGHNNLVRGLAFSPDGKRLASASADKTVKVWNAQTGEELLTLKGPPPAGGKEANGTPAWHEEFVNVTFSPDGRRLAGASADGNVLIWDATPLPEKR